VRSVGMNMSLYFYDTRLTLDWISPRRKGRDG
jgi:hypothetical protein